MKPEMHTIAVARLPFGWTAIAMTVDWNSSCSQYTARGVTISVVLCTLLQHKLKLSEQVTIARDREKQA
jgi:hypothetical protein